MEVNKEMETREPTNAECVLSTTLCVDEEDVQVDTQSHAETGIHDKAKEDRFHMEQGILPDAEKYGLGKEELKALVTAKTIEGEKENKQLQLSSLAGDFSLLPVKNGQTDCIFGTDIPVDEPGDITNEDEDIAMSVEGVKEKSLEDWNCHTQCSPYEGDDETIKVSVDVSVEAEEESDNETYAKNTSEAENEAGIMENSEDINEAENVETLDNINEAENVENAAVGDKTESVKWAADTAEHGMIKLAVGTQGDEYIKEQENKGEAGFPETCTNADSTKTFVHLTDSQNVNIPNDGTGQRPRKRGRPMKYKTVSNPVEVMPSEPLVKRRRTNNSLSNIFDEGADINMDCFSLPNGALGSELLKQKQKAEKMPTRHRNVKLKTLRVELTPIDASKYRECSEGLNKNADLVEKQETVHGPEKLSTLRKPPEGRPKKPGRPKKSNNLPDAHVTEEKSKTGSSQRKALREFPRIVATVSDGEKRNCRGRPRKNFSTKSTITQKSSVLQVPMKPKYLLDYVTEEVTKNGKLAKLFKCKHCDYTTSFMAALVRHYSSHSVPPKQCRFCDFKTRSTQLFYEHETRHTKEKHFQCDKCEYRCRYKRDLSNHQYKHLKEKKFRCPHEGCSFITKWKKNISHHLHSHKTERPFSCHICNMTFKRPQGLKYHLYRHNDVKPKQCEICDFRCKTNYELKMHKLKHSDIRPYPCTYPGCTQRCKVKADLVKHMLIHSKVKNFLCPTCGKGFKSKTEVNKHTRRHSELRSFSCDLCDRSFKFMGALRKHLKNHQGIKPYECEICGHLFSTRSNKDNHMVTHDYSHRPFRCPICPYGARCQEHLLAHIGTMHGRTYAFFCELCKKPFKRYAQLKVHHSRMHTKEEFNRYMNSVGINIEQIQKEVKVEMVDQGLISREEISQMQVRIQEEDESDDYDDDDCSHEGNEEKSQGHEGKNRSTEAARVSEESDNGTKSNEESQCSSVDKEPPQDSSCESSIVQNLPSSDGEEGSKETEAVENTTGSGDDGTAQNSTTNPTGKSNNDSSETGSVRIKTEPKDNFSVSATLAIYDGFRLPLFTKGFEFNIDKSGKKPRSWFMEMENMPSEAKWHQQRYFNRLGGYEAKRARNAERKRIFEETGEDIKIDLRKGRKRKRTCYNEDDDDDEDFEMVEEKRRGRPPKEVSAEDLCTEVKKRRGRPPKVNPKSTVEVSQLVSKDGIRGSAPAESAGKEGVTHKRRGRPPKRKVDTSDTNSTNFSQSKVGTKRTKRSLKMKVKKTARGGKIKEVTSKEKQKGKKATGKGGKSMKGKSVVNSNRKISPLKLKLKKNEKQSKWVCKEVAKEARKKGSGAKNDSVKTKGKRRGRKKKEKFVIDWEGLNQSRDGTNGTLAELSSVVIKVENPEEEMGHNEKEGQGHDISHNEGGGQGHKKATFEGNDGENRSSLLVETDKEDGLVGLGSTQPLTTFYSDDVVLLTRPIRGHGVMNMPAQEDVSNVTIESSSDLTVFTSDFGPEKNSTLGGENVMVSRNPEVPDITFGVVNQAQDEAVELCPGTGQTDIKVEMWA